MESKDLLRSEESRKMAKDLVDRYEIDKIGEMIRDNKISFLYKDVEYRVRLLNQKEKDELDLLRRAKFGELLQNKNILFEKELTKLYKEKGIDVEEIDNKIKKLSIEMKSIQMKTGEALEKNEPESILNSFEEDIKEIMDEIYALTCQKVSLLENSFEKTLEDNVIKFLSWLSLERKEKEEYVRAFNKLDDFLKSEDELISKAIIYSMSLNYRI